MHIYLEAAAAGVAIVPLAAILLAWKRTHDRRMALAALAFVVFEVRVVSMLLLHTAIAADHSTEEMVEFAGDLAVVTALAGAFLQGTRWKRVQDVASDT